MNIEIIFISYTSTLTNFVIRLCHIFLAVNISKLSMTDKNDWIFCRFLLKRKYLQIIRVQFTVLPQ